MDENGNGVLIELSRLGQVEGGKLQVHWYSVCVVDDYCVLGICTNLVPLALQGFDENSFRHMCILSGCDYLPSIPGMGLATANKMLKKFGRDPHKASLSLTQIHTHTSGYN